MDGRFTVMHSLCTASSLRYQWLARHNIISMVQAHKIPSTISTPQPSLCPHTATHQSPSHHHMPNPTYLSITSSTSTKTRDSVSLVSAKKQTRMTHKASKATKVKAPYSNLQPPPVTTTVETSAPKTSNRRRKWL